MQRQSEKAKKSGATKVREAEHIASPAATTVSWAAMSFEALP